MHLLNHSLLLISSIALACIALPMHAQSASANEAARIAGCWRSDKPMGPGGYPESVVQDQAYRTFVLRDSGYVALPDIPANAKRSWEDRSFWLERGDSVTLTPFTGLQGWTATLRPTGDGRTMAGSARYLTDAIAVGAPPIMRQVTLTRIACDPSWPSVATSSPRKRPWQSGGYIFFEHQVDKAAAIAPGTLPAGIITARALRPDESGKLDSNDVKAGVARVVLQMVVESDGGVDSLGVKVLASDGEEYTRRMFRVLRLLRFQPAMRNGWPVHQLSIQRFELRR